jgi:pimeloyl-ACP methyl ester carboxylesterase
MRNLVAATTLLAGFWGGAAELRGAQTGPDEKPAALAHPGILARIAGGKTINLECMGAGSPTVILTPGLGGSAADWSPVQPQLARATRVCAWDRLGSGFSSKATGRETATETTADLIAALKAARVKGPYVVVGHSLGSYESLLFKDKAPKAVVGMVLVDPSIPDQGDRLNKAVNKPPLSGKALANPLYISSKQVLDPKRNYGAMPLIVLTSTKVPELPPGTPDAVSARATFAAMDAEMHRGHAELAALSSRGVQRVVPDSGHYIQADQPDAVIGAIREVLSIARKKAANE